MRAGALLSGLTFYINLNEGERTMNKKDNATDIMINVTMLLNIKKRAFDETINKFRPHITERKLYQCTDDMVLVAKAELSKDYLVCLLDTIDMDIPEVDQIIALRTYIHTFRAMLISKLTSLSGTNWSCPMTNLLNQYEKDIIVDLLHGSFSWLRELELYIK